MLQTEVYAKLNKYESSLEIIYECVSEYIFFVIPYISCFKCDVSEMIANCFLYPVSINLPRTDELKHLFENKLLYSGLKHF